MKANLKAVQGDLFFLEKYIFFVSKQPSLIELSNVHSAHFSRIAASSRTFDLKIVTKTGPEYAFTSMNKEEHEPVEAYLKDKKVKVKQEVVPDADLMLVAAVGDDEDEDDEDMRSVNSDNSGRRTKSRRNNDDESEEDGTGLFSL
jgi:structure-specific recognition protein 1